MDVGPNITLPSAAPRTAREALGRVTEVTGAQISVGLLSSARTDAHSTVTVGEFLGILSGGSVTIGMVTEIAEQAGRDASYRSIARLDLVGEIKAAEAPTASFQRGVTEYPIIGEPAVLISDRELRLIFGTADADHARIGDVHQDATISAHIRIDDLVSRHFAVLGTTGVGKSNGVAIILQEILQSRPNLRIFLVDPHNEYANCFGDKAQVLTPRNLKLPFWLFNFEEIVDAFFGGRPGIDEEIEILSEVIPQAKAAYLQYRSGSALDRTLAKKKDPRNTGFTADTPVPYRLEDLINLIDERMGKLENRSSRMVYHKLMQRIQTFRNHPRYSFMFDGANLGGDTMAEIIGNLFRLPPNGKPMTIMQLAGFPAEVVDSVVSVLCRMAFDFGLWSDGAAPLLFVCEEAHRYAPANSKIGFGPTRRALSRIAKEGRKYGVFLGLVTQRPAEIDPTIISQCSTLFVMRMSNEGDQNLIRSAVSDAASNLLSFIPSLGTREVFAFGAGVPLPTRLKFKELPHEVRPASEASGSTRSDRGASADRNMIASVIERWRAATMSHKSGDDDLAELGGFGGEAPSLQPVAAPSSPHSLPPGYPAGRPAAPAAAPAAAAAPAPREPLRSSLLRKPLDAGPGPASPPPARRW